MKNRFNAGADNEFRSQQVMAGNEFRSQQVMAGNEFRSQQVMACNEFRYQQVMAGNELDPQQVNCYYSESPLITNERSGEIKKLNEPISNKKSCFTTW